MTLARLRPIAPNEWPQEANHPLLGHPNFTLCSEDGTLAYVGIVIMWPGVAEAWLTPAPLLYARAKLCIRSLPALIEYVQKKWNLHRIYCYTRPETLRFAEAVGFQSEGRLYKHAPDGSDLFVCCFVGVE